LVTTICSQLEGLLSEKKGPRAFFGSVDKVHRSFHLVKFYIIDLINKTQIKITKKQSQIFQASKLRLSKDKSNK